MNKLYLGVDGGGTNCRVRLADESLQTLAEVTNGRSNLQLENGEPAYRSIMEGTRDVFASAGIDYSETANTFACLCMAGGRLPADRDAFEKRPWPFAAVKVYDDIDAAHAGALGGGEGAVIIAGTGSAALAIVDGQRHQCGGWGFHVGDQMSGGILGRELVRRAVEATDGLIPGSPLTEAVVQTLGGSLDAVMAWSFPSQLVVDDHGKPQPGTIDVRTIEANGMKWDGFSVTRAPKEFGDFTRMILDYFDKGDPVAVELVALEMSYIDIYVRWFKARGATRMAATGGLGVRLFPQLVERYGDFIVKPVGENLFGALVLARQNFASR